MFLYITLTKLSHLVKSKVNGHEVVFFPFSPGKYFKVTRKKERVKKREYLPPYFTETFGKKEMRYLRAL